MAAQQQPNDASAKEQAEGSPDHVNTEQGGGITNRPLDEEQQNQQDLPPRGESKGGAHA